MATERRLRGYMERRGQANVLCGARHKDLPCDHVELRRLDLHLLHRENVANGVDLLHQVF